MRLTSSSFFHFAKDFDTIKAILIDGFKVFYCSEEIYSTHCCPLKVVDGFKS